MSRNNKFKIIFIKFCIIFALFISNAQADEATGSIKIVAADVISTILHDIYKTAGKCSIETGTNYYSKASGRIDFIGKIKGQYVKAGDLLLSIDASRAEALKSKAKVAFDAGKYAFERDRILFLKKIISADNFQNSKVKFENSKLDLANAIDDYKNSFIKAPISGYINIIDYKTGDLVKEGDYLFTIIAEDEKTVTIYLPQNLIDKLDDQTRIWIKDTNNNQVIGRIGAKSNFLNDNGTFTAKVIFSSEAKILHNSYIDLNIEHSFHENLAVPEKAIMKNNKGNFLYKIVDGKAKQIYVEIALQVNDFIEVISTELSVGDKIIVEGLTKVNDGSAVEIITDKNNKGA